MNVKPIRMNVNLESKYVNNIIVSDNRHILSVKKDPLMNNNLQAHFAGAKRQQHLQKELVLQYIISSSSIIHQDKRQREPKSKRLKCLPVTAAKKQAGLSSFSINLFFLQLWVLELNGLSLFPASF